MRSRAERDDADDVLVDVSGAPGSDDTVDELISHGVERPRRRSVLVPGFLLVVAATAAAIVQGIGSSEVVDGHPSHRTRDVAGPPHRQSPEGGFVAKTPGDCPSAVFCTVVPTATSIRTSIRSAVTKRLGRPVQLHVVTRMRPATVSDHRSMYTRVVTARIGTGSSRTAVSLKIVISRSPIDAATDSVQADGRADIRYESRLADYEVVGVLGIPGLSDRPLLLGLTRLVDDPVLVAGRT